MDERALIARASSPQAASALGGSVCAFGVFDGVHLGHRSIIDAAVADARERGAAAIVLTFDRDPDAVLAPGKTKKLMPDDRRVELLSRRGADMVAVMPFSRAFAGQEPVDFLNSLFGGGAPSAMHVGCDFRFGAHAHGTVDDLAAWGSAHGMEAVAHPLESLGGAPITSTRIRALLECGDVERAAQLLGRPYRLFGTVEHGRGEGEGFGFATANIAAAPELQTVGSGVYGGYAHVGSRIFKAALSCGVAPMFPDAPAPACEAHILDFEGDLYESELSVDFACRLRPMLSFDSVDALIARVKADIAWIRENL